MSFGRLGWLCWRRWRMAASVPGFHAGLLTYACSQSRFGNEVLLKRGAHIEGSVIGRWSRIQGIVSSTAMGSFCSVGPEAIIGGMGRHAIDQVSTHSTFNLGPECLAPQRTLGLTQTLLNSVKQTMVGHDVWVASRAMILNGVDIGTGAVVAAGAVVTHPVPAYAIVAGVPARVIRFRFEAPLREALLASCWWDWSEPRLKVISRHFTDDGPLTLEKWQRIAVEAAELPEV